MRQPKPLGIAPWYGGRGEEDEQGARWRVVAHLLSRENEAVVCRFVSRSSE